ncbi:transposase [Streptomyces sp. NBC_01615]|uniref:transposase n=1 Tax=Streptomyces sp. NBC_01615 TaxID=2975898 RepID=UPI0038630290
MSRRLWQRPLVLVVASVALAAGTACAAQASPSATAGTGHVAAADQSSHCGRGGEGGEGGKGGEGGRGGEPGRPGEPGKPGTSGCFRFRDLPDKPKSKLTAMDRIRIVMAVESGQAKKAEVAKKYKVSEKEIDTWVKQFRDGDWAALMGVNSLFGS